MATFVGNFAASGFLPDDLARRAIKCDDGELVELGRFGAGAEAAALAAFALLVTTARWWRRRWGRCHGWGAGDFFRRFDGGQKEDSVLPDDRSGEAVAGDLGFPFDVLSVTPRRERLRAGGDASAGRSAPRGPRRSVGGEGRRRKENERYEGKGRGPERGFHARKRSEGGRAV